VVFAKRTPGKCHSRPTAVGGIYWSAGLMMGPNGREFQLVPQEGSAAFVVSQLAGGHMDLGIAGAAAPGRRWTRGTSSPWPSSS